jgi:hypothetical protein
MKNLKAKPTLYTEFELPNNIFHESFLMNFDRLFTLEFLLLLGFRQKK